MPDQEDIKHQQELLRRHRQRLAVIDTQLTTLGVFAPAYMRTEADEARGQIRRIKGILRDWGVQIVDQIVDEEPTLSSSSATETPPTTTVTPKKPRRSVTGDFCDVFVSYDPADKQWVQTDLLPQLDDAGIKAIDQRDFALGVPKLVNIERAVEQSRYVLLVLSPDWVKSEWTAFESLLAQTDGIADKRWSTLPLLLRPCELPKRIAMLDRTDLSDPTDRVDQMRRLINFILSTKKTKTRSRSKS